MCGIGGQLLHAARTPDPGVLRTMADAMVSRGPDDEGSFSAPHVGLVHRRLSIRDLSAAGRCPMASPSGLVQVVLNGEIYNWRELRSELEATGVAFHSHSDTEVIVHGYVAWGDDLVRRLRGMFAFAIWDAGRQRLLLARDRVGEKPLYWRLTTAGLDFASCIEALALSGATTVVDPDAVACYFAHSFVPANHTVWDGIQVLPPAHTLAIVPGGQPELRCYWEFPRQAPVARPLSESLRTTEAVLEDSVRRCLDADVPVGVFLSGGVDSSLIAAMASRHHPDIAAFSLGFREAEFSELEYAEKVARHLGIPHHVRIAAVEDVRDCLLRLVPQYGQPFGDASAVPTYLVSRTAREHVKVCLSGDGGDELFGGYWRLQAGVYADRYGRLVPRVVRTRVVPAIGPALGPLGSRLLAMNALATEGAATSYSNYESWYLHFQSLAGPRLREGLRHPLAACRAPAAPSRADWTVVQTLLFQDFQVQLPDDYLTKVDVASMTSSLEVRAPFLDQAVVEHAWLLPDSTKLNWGRRKWLLKKIAARHVPADVVYRRKMGFALPLEAWWRGMLGDWLRELMAGSVGQAEGWLDGAAVLRCLDEHRAGRNHHTRLWLALWFELWMRLVATASVSERRERLARLPELQAVAADRVPASAA